MDDVATGSDRKRGLSASHMRAFTCKDCQREVEHLEEDLARLERRGAGQQEIKKVRTTLNARREKATYNENWARNLVERGGSRSDRCKEHRQKHRVNIQGLAVAYIDLQTLGEVADRGNPTGPLGGLGPLPTAHEIVPKTSYDLQEVRVGMTDAHVTKMIELLREKQVLILKAGTGTGKSTFAPYRLMDPPPIRLSASLRVRRSPSSLTSAPSLSPSPASRRRSASLRSSAGRCRAPEEWDRVTRLATRSPATATTTRRATSSTLLTAP